MTPLILHDNGAGLLRNCCGGIEVLASNVGAILDDSSGATVLSVEDAGTGLRVEQEGTLSSALPLKARCEEHQRNGTGSAKSLPHLADGPTCFVLFKDLISWMLAPVFTDNAGPILHVRTYTM